MLSDDWGSGSLMILVKDSSYRVSLWGAPRMLPVFKPVIGSRESIITLSILFRLFVITFISGVLPGYSKLVQGYFDRIALSATCKSDPPDHVIRSIDPNLANNEG